MQTSETRQTAAPKTPTKTPVTRTVTTRTIAIEAIAACALALGATALLSPGDLGFGSLYPHPVWAAVALLATRYGSRGLATSVGFGWGLALLGGAVLRTPMSLVLARASSGADLGALLSVVLIAWVASVHERRAGQLAAAVSGLEERNAADREALNGLRTTAVVLRARADRLETSLTFMRDVAVRLEGNDPVEAAQAALDLAMARIGARAGLVAAIDDGGLAPVAVSGPWETTPDLRADRTAAAAVRNRRATRAVDLSDSATGDSDLAAPIVSDEVGMVGLIVLHGVPQGGASAAAVHDLALIAGWCARALASPRVNSAPPFADEANGEGMMQDASLDDESRGKARRGTGHEATVVRFNR
jgi:hypothetical protein